MKTKISKKSSYKKIWIFHKKEQAISYLVPCYEFWWYVACKFIYFVPLLEVCCGAVLFLSIVVCCVVCSGLSVVLVITQLLLQLPCLMFFSGLKYEFIFCKYKSFNSCHYEFSCYTKILLIISNCSAVLLMMQGYASGLLACIIGKFSILKLQCTGMLKLNCWRHCFVTLCCFLIVLLWIWM